MNREQQKDYNEGQYFFRRLYPHARQQMLEDDGWEWRDYFAEKPSPAFFEGFYHSWQVFEETGIIL